MNVHFDIPDFDITELLPGLPNAGNACSHRLTGRLVSEEDVKSAHVVEGKSPRGGCLRKPAKAARRFSSASTTEQR
ncbi:hypothetical protein CRI93_12760 [Longimonas halophila]|jgi:hypothetical protein|uniref:Uncharacterized protein n=1 Tax=Longimonas halophila TaxID=1469170 RepID=A0A2H3NQQ8_9BACT|nr:hypothetical protein CRI93_12760 [Longimonas halophila]